MPYDDSRVEVDKDKAYIHLLNRDPLSDDKTEIPVECYQMSPHTPLNAVLNGSNTRSEVVGPVHLWREAALM